METAPLLPKEGLQCIGEVCAKGRGEGAARAAGVLAMDSDISDWRRALDWLRLSAEAGWNDAQRQLLALADAPAFRRERRRALLQMQLVDCAEFAAHEYVEGEGPARLFRVVGLDGVRQVGRKDADIARLRQVPQSLQL